jgi:ATP-dependent Clp protease adaptor protein ClpS
MSNNTDVIEKKKTDVKEPQEPGKVNVICMNDDKTPVEFVIAMLVSIFRHESDHAVKLTLQIHNDGSAVVGTYSNEIAEQKVVDATSMARMNGFPLVLKTAAQ